MSPNSLKEITNLEIIKAREPYRFEQTSLPNGGELYFQQAKIPFIQLGILFKFGSRQDPPGKEGLIHMLDHLLPSKTEKFPSFLAIREYEEKHGVGANYGEISFDSFRLFGFSLKEDFPHLLHLLSQVISFSRYGPKDLVHEKKVVIQELRRKMLPQIRKVWNEVGIKTFGNSPLSRIDNLGEEETIASLHLKDIQKFEKQYLNPQNAAFILIGDYQLNEIKNLLTETFPPKRGRLIALRSIFLPSPSELRSEYSKKALGIKGETQAELEWSFSFSSSEFFKLCDIALWSLKRKLTAELREKRDWTYEIKYNWRRLKDLGGGWITTLISPGHEKETEKIFWQVVKEVASDTRLFKTYQQMILKSLLAIDASYNATLMYGLDSIPVEEKIPLLMETYQKTAALTFQSFQSFFKNYLSPDRTHLTIFRP